MENLSCTIDLFFLLGPMKVVFQNNLSLQDFTHCTTSKRHGHKQTEICPGSDRSRCVVDCRNVSPNITGSGPNNHIENSEITHPKTKMSHERWWLEDLQPFQDGHFLGNILTFCGGNYRSAVSSHIETLCFFSASPISWGELVEVWKARSSEGLFDGSWSTICIPSCIRVFFFCLMLWTWSRK